jgi:succinate dehydrogenase / fumarate reductase flavoprotein subunit
MQGLADGYFVLPYTIGNYLATQKGGAPDPGGADFKKMEKEVADRTQKLLDINGSRTVDWFHRELGKIIWNKCGMARNEAGLKEALSEIPALRDEFWKDVRVLGSGQDFNQSLEKAGRVADFLEFGELMCEDALQRDESCGGHFREEHQTDDGEAKRNDEEFAYVSAWEFNGVGEKPTLHKEELDFEYVHLAVRSYK